MTRKRPAKRMQRRRFATAIAREIRARNYRLPCIERFEDRRMLAVVSFQQGVDGYVGAQDTYISPNTTGDPDAAGSNFGTRTTLLEETAQILLEFDDIIGVDKIPAGSHIISATLELNVEDETPSTIYLYRMLQSWVAGDGITGITWDNDFDGDGVDINGVEAAASSTASFLPSFSPDPLGSVIVTDLASDVQAWVDGVSNFGWVMRRNSGNNHLLLSSSEATIESNRPKLVVTFEADSGDAPAPYPTTNADNGAFHIATGPMQGANRDIEPDGIATTNANGDDTTGSPDDEDGVTFGTLQVGALGASVTVNVQGGSGKLDAWIDFNGDGSWGGPGEQIADSVPVSDAGDGNNTITFDIPAWAAPGETYARFRLSTAGNVGIGGAAVDGEVEDYQVTISAPAMPPGPQYFQFDMPDAVAKAEDIAVVDLDNDGDMDIVSAGGDSSINDTLIWWQNDGSDSFERVDIFEPDSSSGFGQRSVAVADFNGDGVLDVVNSTNQGGVAWFDGAMSFQKHVVDSTDASFHRALPADIDGDGDQDIVAAVFSEDEIRWYVNDGNGNFTANALTVGASLAEAGPVDIAAADIDNDGDIDIAAPLADHFAWYESQNGTFIEHVIEVEAAGARFIAPADINADGYTDLVVAMETAGEIAWFQNDGHENFAANVHVLTTDFDTARSAIVSDFNGDGQLDIAASGGSSGSGDISQILLWINQGGGNFSPFPITVATAGQVDLPVRIAAGDVDSDGVLDIVAASRNANRISWFAALESVSVFDGNLLFEDHAGAPNSLSLSRIIVEGVDMLQVVDSQNPIAAGRGAIQGDANTIFAPIDSVSGSIQIDGGLGDDLLTIDFSAGNPIPTAGLTFNGGAHDSAGDSLAIIGDGTNVVYNATGTDGLSGDGNLDWDGSPISFTGLEPVDLSAATLTDFTINVDPSNTVAGTVTTTVSADDTTNTLVAFDNGFESTLIGAITGTLTINGDGVDDDVITVSGVGSAFAANLTIDGQGGDDSIDVGGHLSLGGNLSLTGDTIEINSAVETNGGDVTFSATDGVTVNAAISTAGGAFEADSDSNVDGVGKLAVSSTGSIASGAGNIEIAVADLDLAGSLSGSGLTIRPSTASSDIVIGDTPIITRPEDLNFGDEYRLVYVTSETRNAVPTDLATYDDWIKTNTVDPNRLLSDLDAAWKVLGSVSGTGARDHTDTNPEPAPNGDGTGVPIYLLNGDKFAEDYEHLWGTGTITTDILTSLNVTELGTQLGGATVWTGTNADGTAHSNPLGTGAPSSAVRGRTNTDTSAFINGSGPDPNGPEAPNHLYAISGELTAGSLLRLDSSEIALLADGFSSITIGDETNGTGFVEVASATFTDPVTIAGGVIRDLGNDTDITSPSVAIQGNLSPGNSPGVFSIDGDAAIATTTIEIDGTAGPGVENGHDQIVATGQLGLNEDLTLDVSDIESGELAPGDTFTILQADGGITGTFTNLADGQVVATASGLQLVIRYTANTVEIVASQPRIDFKTATSATADESAADHPVTLVLSVPGGGTLASPYAVTVTSANGTAQAGEDYTAVNTTLTFPSGSADGAEMAVNLPILADDLVELDEDLVLTLTGQAEPAPAGSQLTHTVTITDDDSATITVGDASVQEGDSGTTTLSFPVTLSQPVDVDISFDYQTNDDDPSATATAGSDYVSQSATSFSIVAGTQGTVGTIDITITGDTTVELNETLTLLLKNLQTSDRDTTLSGTGVTVDAWSQIGEDIDGESAVDQSGYSVATSADGETVVIGAVLNDGNGTDSGHVRIYRLNANDWRQVGGDIDGERADDQSGTSVATSADGDTVVIGASRNGANGEWSGHVRVYRLIGNEWTKVGADIDGESVGDRFGNSVAMSVDGNTIVIGAGGNDGQASDAGHVRVFQLINGGWTQVGVDIDGQAANEKAGSSVATSSDGKTVVVGAPYSDGLTGTSSGKVRVYRFNGTEWSRVGGDINGEAAYDNLGSSVATSSDGDTVVIGAPYSDGVAGIDSGKVQVYRFNGTEWSQVGGDINGEAAFDNSGSSVAITADGNTVVIGAPNNYGVNGRYSGQVRVYELIGGEWIGIGKEIDGETADDRSGHSVATSADGKTVAIGARTGNDNVSGQVRVYRWTGGSVTVTGTIGDDDAATISVRETSVIEAGNLTFDVTLSYPVDVDTVITYSTADGTATAGGNDYTGHSNQTLTIPANTTTGTIIVPTGNDDFGEPNEQMTLNIVSVDASGRDVTVQDGSATGTILTDEVYVEISGGDLVLQDLLELDNSLSISLIDGGTKIRVHDASQPIFAGEGATQADANTITVPVASLAVDGSIQLLAGGGADALTIDFSGGNFSHAISYDGGEPSSSPGDSLTLTGGGTFDNVTHVIVDESSGSVDITGNTLITYTGLEPVTDNLSSTERVFEFTGGEETITLSDDATAGNGMSLIDSTLGESIAFANPPDSLTIHTSTMGGSGADTIIISGLDSAWSADVIVTADDDDDIRFESQATSTGGGDLTVSGLSIAISAPLTTSGGKLDISARDGVALGDSLHAVGEVNRIDADSNADGVGNLTLSASTPPTLQDSIKLLGDDTTGGDEFGTSVSISGNLAVVGAPEVNNEAGAAYVFIQGPSGWTQEAKLTANTAGDHQFGKSVSISGETIVVGAPDEPRSGSNRGAVYVFTRDAGTWTQQTKLTPDSFDTAGTQRPFGQAVAVDGDRLAVLAYDLDNTRGAAHVFTRSGGSWSYAEQLDTSAAGSFEQFTSVAIGGDKIVVGNASNSHAGGNFAGAAYVFTFDGNSWGQPDVLTADDAAPSAAFGYSVSTDGSSVLIGAEGDAAGGSSAGAAYVFTPNGSDWSQQKLVSPTAEAFDFFGSSVAIYGDEAVVGAYGDGGTFDIGSVFLFSKSSGTWSLVEELTGHDASGDARVGSSLSFDGSTILTGAPIADSSTGAVYLFAKAAGTPGGQITSSSLFVTAADVELNGSVDVTGSLTFFPSQLDSSIGVGGGVGRLNIDDDEIANFSGTFSSINIGHPSGTGAIDIDESTFPGTSIGLFFYGNTISVSGLDGGSGQIELQAAAGGSVLDTGDGIDVRGSRIAFYSGLAPGGGAPGQFQVDGDASIATSTTLTAQIDGSAGVGVENGHDQLLVLGSVSISDGYDAQPLIEQCLQSAAWPVVGDHRQRRRRRDQRLLCQCIWG